MTKTQQDALRAKIDVRERRLAKHASIIRVLHECVTQSRSWLTANRPIEAPHTARVARTTREYQEGFSLLRGYQQLLSARLAQRDVVEKELREVRAQLPGAERDIPPILRNATP